MAMCQIDKTGALALILSLYLMDPSDGARILASVSIPSYSHQVAFRPIWKALAARGHEIVLLTTDPMKEGIKNIRQIDTSFSYELMERHNYSLFVTNSEKNDINPITMINKLVETFSDVNLNQLLHPEVQEMLHNKSEKFDLLMVEIIFPTHLAFADRFKVPIIGLTSMDAPANFHALMGNSAHPVLNSDFTTMTFPHPPNLWQRTALTILQFIMDNIIAMYVFLPKEEETLKKIFGENCKSLFDSMKDIDMLFINVNPVFHTQRAITPNTIIFGGGTHIETTPKPLPEDLKVFLDNATSGAIYFSLGSNIKSNLLRDDLRLIFMETFADLPYKVIWKFETGHLPDKPDNVMVSKWLPQTDVLRHPNIKLFITQCGLQSIEEAIVNRIPMVGLPFFADQPSNGNTLQRRGFGVTLEHSTLTKDIFKETIMEVITNPKYKETLTEAADLLRDVEMTGLEKAVWWTEYVIRNKGAKLFKNPILDLPFYQYYLLDVIAFVFAIMFIILFTTYKIASIVKRKLFNKQSNKSKTD